MKHGAILLVSLQIWAIAATGPVIEAQEASPSGSNAESANATAGEPLFPRKIKLPGGVATFHEPQIDSHEGYRNITMWSACSYKSFDGKVDIVGAIKVKADIIVDFDERLVSVYNRSILESYFPELGEKEAEAFTEQLRSNIRTEMEYIPLDVLLAYLVDDETENESVAVSMAPPTIYYSADKAMLVRIDGKPVARPLSESSDLQLIVNASWDLFQSKKSSTYYLLMGKHWVKSKKLDGPWTPAGKLPKSFKKLPEDERFDIIRKSVPGDWIAKKDLPRIFVTTEPAEMIVTDGSPRLEEIKGSSLFFVSNSTSDIFYDNGSLEYYFLTSGRWFKSKNLEGPWTESGELPNSFQSIPEDHAKAHVRSSIPETIEAKFAVLEAQVPKTAVISRDLQASETTYIGEPKFEAIDTTNVSRAVNTQMDVFLVSGKYYLCENAVWFVSDTPTGPWQVADSVPSDIYDIPSSSPSYNVTYVTVDSSTSSHVHCSYTSGYHHSYISYGVVVYGSGYHWGFGYNYYDPFYPYPYWGYPYHYPYTYGSASFYNPRTGAYGHGHYTYGPYGGGWAGERYNPRSGRYGQGQAAWDYNTAVYQGRSYNPRTNIATSTSQAYQYYGGGNFESWGSSKVQRGNDWVTSDRYSNQRGSAYRFESSAGGKGGRLVTDNGKAGLYRGSEGGLYATKNGNVYRKSENGSWEQRNRGEWNSVDNRLSDQQRESLKQRSSQIERPKVDSATRSDFQKRYNRGSGNLQQLDRDSFNRNYGNQRFQNFQRSGGSNFGGGSRTRSGSFGSRRR